MSKKTYSKIRVHHITPTSRRGERIPENELHIYFNIHNAWHVLFGNLLIDEVVAIIKYCWQDGQGKIREKYLIGESKKIRRRGKTFIRDKRLSAWQTIFGDIRSADEVIRMIKETFTKRT